MAKGSIISWENVEFAPISLVAAVTQAAIGSGCVGANVLVRPACEKVDSYISRMNHYAMLGVDRRETFTRRMPNGRFMPLRTIGIDDDVNVSMKELGGVINRSFGADQSFIDAMRLAFGEILDNVIQHSESHCGGLACAQYYPRMKYVELCVVDSGQGISQSMAENDDYASILRDELVAKAFEPKTGQWYGRTLMGSQHVSGGMGLALTAALAKHVNGHIWAVSRDGSAHIDSLGIHVTKGLSYPGTVIVVRLPVDPDTVVPAAVMYQGAKDKPMRWSASEGMYYDSDDSLW